MGFAFLRNEEIYNCIPLLKKAIILDENNSNKAISHALLASAYAHLDNLKKSRQHMKIALNLDPDEFMVNKIYTEINIKSL
ncbi:MAG: hypothetical protein JXJ04_18760 [Spirochaetales bacterium]|nr:hypothetical protein [Spirochaetales bacterium]